MEAPDQLGHHLEADPPKVRGPSELAQRHFERVPMEPIAERTGGRQHNPSHSGWNWVSCAALDSAKSWAAWEWQAADGAMGKARLGGIAQPNGSRQGWQQAEPACGSRALSIVVAGANAHDATLLDETLEAIVVERPQLTEDDPQHLCLDKGYDPSSRRQTRLSATTHRRGEVGRFWAQAVSCAPVGCGTDSRWLSKCRDATRVDSHPVGFRAALPLSASKAFNVGPCPKIRVE